MTLRAEEKIKLRKLIVELIGRAQSYWGTDCHAWFGRGKPIPEHYAPGGVIRRLSRDERWLLEQATPEDFQDLRLDFVRPDVHFVIDKARNE